MRLPKLGKLGKPALILLGLLAVGYATSSKQSGGISPTATSSGVTDSQGNPISSRVTLPSGAEFQTYTSAGQTFTRFVPAGGYSGAELIGTPATTVTGDTPPLPSSAKTGEFWSLNARNMSGSGPWNASDLYWSYGMGDPYGYPLKTIRVGF